MTFPKKPAKATLAALVAPPLELTPAEKRMLSSFRALDNRSREFIERTALAVSQRVARRTGPSLKLITGGMAA